MNANSPRWIARPLVDQEPGEQCGHRGEGGGDHERHVESSSDAGIEIGVSPDGGETGEHRGQQGDPERRRDLALGGEDRRRPPVVGRADPGIARGLDGHEGEAHPEPTHHDQHPDPPQVGVEPERTKARMLSVAHASPPEISRRGPIRA